MDPADLRYAKTHEWAYKEGDLVTVGITAFAVEQLTDLVHLELPKPGTKVRAGESFGEVESVKAVSDLYSPVDGEVVEVNKALIDDLGRLASDPYGSGWLARIRVGPAVSLDHLMDLKAYQQQTAAGA